MTSSITWLGCAGPKPWVLINSESVGRGTETAFCSLPCHDHTCYALLSPMLLFFCLRSFCQEEQLCEWQHCGISMLSQQPPLSGPGSAALKGPGEDPSPQPLCQGQGTLLTTASSARARGHPSPQPLEHSGVPHSSCLHLL